jgi:hypothetical protein
MRWPPGVCVGRERHGALGVEAGRRDQQPEDAGLPQIRPVEVPGAVAGGLSVDDVAVPSDEPFTLGLGVGHRDDLLEFGA